MGPPRVTVLVPVMLGVGAASQFQVPGAVVPIYQAVEFQPVVPVFVTVTVMVAPGATVVIDPPFTVADVTERAALAWLVKNSKQITAAATQTDSAAPALSLKSIMEITFALNFISLSTSRESPHCNRQFFAIMTSHSIHIHI